jgi:lipoprotein-anchoring transpeptidase ErfK/SrfK
VILKSMALLAVAIILSGCATDGDNDWLGLGYEVNEFDSKNYAALPGEKFAVAPFDVRDIKPKYRRRMVNYATTESPGTIVVDTANRYLYLIAANGRAMRYSIEVGRDGFGWSGVADIARKAEWPIWTPPAEMVARDPLTAPFAKGMPGGPENPLGARALYLYQNGTDTLYRIHGGGHPTRLGKATSSGCIRLLDHDVIDLYNRVPAGTRTVVRSESVVSELARDKM